MATLDTSPISVSQPESLPARRLDPIPGVSPRGKFKERINKIRFKRKPSLVAEHPLDSTGSHSDSQLPADPNDSGVNLTSDVTPSLSQDDTSIHNVLQTYTEETPSDPLPTPTDTLDLSSYSNKVLGVTLLCTDPLRPHIHLSHPLVKLTLYCEKSGTHFKKSEKSRAVSSYYETANERVDYILPQLTEPAVVNTSNGFTPRWGEDLVFNEDLSYLLSSPSIVLLFELLEFKGRPLPASPPRRQGWRHIAWAFLKLRGVKNRVNLGQSLRLQLYSYPNRTGAGDDLGFQAWYHGSRVKYPSTLHVTARGVQMRDQTQAALRSCAPNQPERATVRQQERAESSDLSRPASVPWSRLSGHTCMVPNNPILASPLPGAGGSVLAFSLDGYSLAVCVLMGQHGEVLVYAIPSCEERLRLKGHQGIIYDLSWSPSSLLLLTASQDTTARVWSLSDPHSPLPCCKLLPHPSFVYACAFHPASETILLTAGFDRVVRVWGVAAVGVNSGQILREFRSHGGYVNCLAFDKTGMRMFSGDSEGCVCVWQMSLSRSGSSPASEEVDTWRELDRLELRETRGTAVRSIFSVDRRLLLHTSDGTLRLVDTRRQAVLKRFLAHSPQSPLSRCGLSPCDTHVFLGTGTDLCVWRLDTGKKTHFSLQQLSLPSAHISCVDYHPLDHMLALSTYGTSGSILVSRYTPESNALAETENRPQSLTASRSSLSSNLFADTAMLLLREKVRERLNSVCTGSVPGALTEGVSGSRRLSSTWDSLGSLTTSPARLLGSPPTLPEIGEEGGVDSRLDEYESTGSQDKSFCSELTLGMLGRTLSTPARECVTPLYSTSELEEVDTEVREKAKRSIARRRRTVNKQKSVEHSVTAE